MRFRRVQIPKIRRVNTSSGYCTRPRDAGNMVNELEARRVRVISPKGVHHCSFSRLIHPKGRFTVSLFVHLVFSCLTLTGRLLVTVEKRGSKQ